MTVNDDPALSPHGRVKHPLSCGRSRRVLRTKVGPQAARVAYVRTAETASCGTAVQIVIVAPRTTVALA
jgi:hypothetical protein